MRRISKMLRQIWRGLRTLSGDDTYERYLADWCHHHAHDSDQPLNRKAFYQAEQERKWNGVRRCC